MSSSCNSLTWKTVSTLSVHHLVLAFPSLIFLGRFTLDLLILIALHLSCTKWNFPLWLTLWWCRFKSQVSLYTCSSLHRTQSCNCNIVKLLNIIGWNRFFSLKTLFLTKYNQTHREDKVDRSLCKDMEDAQNLSLFQNLSQKHLSAQLYHHGSKIYLRYFWFQRKWNHPRFPLFLSSSHHGRSRTQHTSRVLPNFPLTFTPGIHDQAQS